MQKEIRKNLSQDDWVKIYSIVQQRITIQENDETMFCPLGALLMEHGFNTEIENIDFSESNNMRFVLFDNMTFRSCKFSEIDFSNSIFHDVALFDCEFDKILLCNTSFYRCIFNDCEFLGIGFSGVIVVTTNFIRCDFKLCSWVNAQIERVHFSHVEMKEEGISHAMIRDTVFFYSELSYSCWNQTKLINVFMLKGNLVGASFFENSVEKSYLIEVDLTDCLLFDKGFYTDRAELPVLNKPIIGMTWNFLDQGLCTPLIANVLRERGACVLKIDMESAGIAVEQLANEVANGIAHAQNSGDSRMSIPENLLAKCSPESVIGLVKKRARSALAICHALVLPGGKDIQHEFYGATRKDGPEFDGDYRRSITEFSLYFCARELEMPVMGICRGAQTINVYHGGSLRQPIDSVHKGKNFQYLTLTESCWKERMQVLFAQESPVAWTAHHQGIVCHGEFLEPVLECSGVPKLLISKDGMVIASQVHPEACLMAGISISEAAKKTSKILFDLFLNKVSQFFHKK
ncbi:MAG: gamma-glutamyl-gamma-aminobutyrate hydrolase family protein [Verrucomicrobiota bacterium]|nr:gamma-glutamyl-gamma-aminobutyrate hydrolase family protein [Verrucomicrobiota bacterium]